VAPGLNELGVFLPPTPLQHLLLADGPPLQVMTSGNLSEEPIACDDEDALRRLRGIADVFLLHDRVIHTRADDSVVRVLAGKSTTVRRARGYAPEAVTLPIAGPPVLAVGAQLKATVCLSQAGQAVLSQHLGDLDDADTFAFFRETVTKLSQLTGIRPQVIAHDLHPDLRSTRWARTMGLPLLPVQHHHAHIASCMVENGRCKAVLGVAFDGTGYGPDGTMWGGEFMVADLGGYRRVGHLRALAMLGGQAAIRAPWRLALAALLDAGESADHIIDDSAAASGARTLDRQKVQALGDLWHRRNHNPQTTGAGRWFDAVAALCGLRAEITYEGQAAIEWEALCAPADDRNGQTAYDIAFDAADGAFVVDLRPMIRGIVADRRRSVPLPLIAARFHQTMAQIIVESCCRARTAGAPDVVALSGGCFQNRRLTELSSRLLADAGFQVLLQRRIPCNDGGLALGQAAIASCRQSEIPCA
jgi:hydrogenase maturation protein HypF